MEEYISQNNQKYVKKNSEKWLALQIIKTYYEITIIKTMWYWNKEINRWGGGSNEPWDYIYISPVTKT